MTFISQIPLSNIVLVSGFILILIGLWGMLTQRHLIRLIIGFSLMDTGIHMVMVALGYITEGTAPIVNEAVDKSSAAQLIVDPVPSALVLTAIVIGLAITGMMLSFAVRIYHTRKTLMIDDLTESKG